MVNFVILSQNYNKHQKSDANILPIIARLDSTSCNLVAYFHMIASCSLKGMQDHNNPLKAKHQDSLLYVMQHSFLGHSFYHLFYKIVVTFHPAKLHIPNVKFQVLQICKLINAHLPYVRSIKLPVVSSTMMNAIRCRITISKRSGTCWKGIGLCEGICVCRCYSPAQVRNTNNKY